MIQQLSICQVDPTLVERFDARLKDHAKHISGPVEFVYVLIEQLQEHCNRGWRVVDVVVDARSVLVRDGCS